MNLRDVFRRFPASNKRITVAAGAALVAGIAWFDWQITAQVPLGFLYLLPMFLFGRALGTWPIVAVAGVCTALAEAYDGFPLTLIAGVSRLLLYFAAFATTGLFVREIQRRRLQAANHLQEIEQQRDAIREAEVQLEALIESSPAAIVTTDASGHIVMANEAAHRLFAAPADGLAEKLVQVYLPSLANAIDGNSSQPRFRAVMQSRGFRQDGEVFLADICFSTYPTASGVRLTAMIVDNSEGLREHEESSLHQLLTGSRIVAGAMSHEIRNICGAIAIVHQNLLRGGVAKGNQDFDALGSLIHTLEEIAAVELRYAATPTSEVDLTAVLDDLRIVVAPTLQEAGIEAQWTFDAELPKVWADRSQLMQIFLNLTNNSVRALSRVEHKHLLVSAHATAGRVTMEFRDNGGGVTEPGKLFRPFQQGAVASGLGLYLSRAFALSMGGDLRYRPAPGEACFVLELLAIKTQEAEVQPEASR